MSKEQKVFLFSLESANSYGYSIGLKKDGTTVMYTSMLDNEDQYKWPDKKIVYKGTTEDFLAIKVFDYKANKTFVYDNKTDEIDPFSKIKEPINLFIDSCGSMGKDLLKDLPKQPYQNNIELISTRGTEFNDSMKSELMKRIQSINKSVQGEIFIDDNQKPKIK